MGVNKGFDTRFALNPSSLTAIRVGKSYLFRSAYAVGAGAGALWD